MPTWRARFCIDPARDRIRRAPGLRPVQLTRRDHGVRPDPHALLPGGGLLLARNWPTGIRIDANGIRIGAVNGHSGTGRTPKRSHGLPGIVAVALAAVMAGARSFAAIGQWAEELPGTQLAELGLSRGVAPDASTFRNVLARLDAPVLDQLAGAFLWTRTTMAGGRPGDTGNVPGSDKSLQHNQDRRADDSPAVGPARTSRRRELVTPQSPVPVRTVPDQRSRTQ